MATNRASAFQESGDNPEIVEAKPMGFGSGEWPFKSDGEAPAAEEKVVEEVKTEKRHRSANKPKVVAVPSAPQKEGGKVEGVIGMLVRDLHESMSQVTPSDSAHNIFEALKEVEMRIVVLKALSSTD